MFPSVQYIKRGKEKSLSNPVMFFNTSIGGIVLYMGVVVLLKKT
jgi:hypothetical protein